MQELLQKWRCLGFDAETYRRFRHALDVHNIVLFQQACAVSLVAVLIAVFSMAVFVPEQGWRALLLALIAALLLVLFLVSRRLAKHTESITRANTAALTLVFELLLYIVTLYLGTVEAEGDLAVTFVLNLLFLQIVFDLPVRQNALIAIPMYALFLVCSHLYKSETNFVYDATHATLAVVVGLFCSYNKTQAQMRGIVFEARLRETNYALYHTSTTDELTQLPNRRMIFEQLRAISEDCPADMRLACVVMDIDDFKGYNDVYGHPAGDVALQRIGVELSAFAQTHNVRIGRIGGEEFLAVWLTDAPEQAKALAEALRMTVPSLEIPHEHAPGGFLTASAGVCCVPPSLAGQAYALADKAAYRAKDRGRDCTCCIDAQTARRPQPAG